MLFSHTPYGAGGWTGVAPVKAVSSTSSCFVYTKTAVPTNPTSKATHQSSAQKFARVFEKTLKEIIRNCYTQVSWIYKKFIYILRVFFSFLKWNTPVTVNIYIVLMLVDF